MTTRRDAVHDTLRQSAGFRSAQDVYAEMRQHGAKIGLTTVYRALQALADGGHVDVLRTDDGESVYRACATGEHHHHLVCRRCGRTVEVEGPAVER
jgi:Fur family transcriptional regulator, ferric uptake regulator